VAFAGGCIYTLLKPAEIAKKRVKTYSHGRGSVMAYTLYDAGNAIHLSGYVNSRLSVAVQRGRVQRCAARRRGGWLPVLRARRENAQLES
jgi:hypothetical protein